jgi:hypothetical protein
VRLVGQPIEDALFSGVFIGDAKASVRLTVEPDWYLTTTMAIGTLEVERGPVRYYQRAANDQVEVEIPNVSNYEDDASVDQPAASCTITIDNVRMDVNDEGDSEDLGTVGYYTPHHGRSIESQARWGHFPNEWSSVLDANALLRSYAGYGGTDKTIPDAVDDGNLMLQGVWLVDDWRVSTRGQLVLQCRNAMSLLIDQPIYPPLVPMGIYPLEFFRWNRLFRDISAGSVSSDLVIPGTSVTAGDKRAVFVDSSVDRWYPEASPGSEVPNGGYILLGHQGDDCLDGSTDTFCLSVGNSSPEKTFCTDWWEFDCGDYINAVYVHPWAGNYTCYISVLENGVWQGDAIVPYTFYPMNGGDRAVDTGADIPYVTTSGVPWETGIEIILPRVYLAERVRVSFRDHHQSPWGPYYYRCGMRELRLRASTNLTTGGSTSSVVSPPLFFAADHIRVQDNLNATGYMTSSHLWQVDPFGDASTWPRNAGPAATSEAVYSLRMIRDGSGYWLCARDGTISSFGSAVHYGDPKSSGFAANSDNGVTEMAVTHTGLGYWCITTNGTVYSFGDAPSYGNPVATGSSFFFSIEAHPTTYGFWAMDTNGKVTAFGGATDHGDFSEAALNHSASETNTSEAAVRIRSTLAGDGYWILTDGGRVQGLGAAPDHGQVDQINTNPTDYFQSWYSLLPAPDNGGYLIMRGDGYMVICGDVAYFGSPIPGEQGELRRPGNYSDYADLVKLLALWSGFHLFNEFEDSTGWPAVYGNIESTGAYAEDPLPLDMFDKQLPADVMKQFAEIVGYIGPYVDEEGGLRFETPNVWNFGNFYSDGSYTSEIPELDERWNLLESTSSGTKQYDRSEIIISTEEPTEAQDTTIVTRYVPPNQQRLRGMSRPAIWVNGAFDNEVDQKVMAELVAMHLWFRTRTSQVSGLYHPGIQINDQIRILDRSTDETATHYVLGKSVSWDAATGVLTMSLRTHWLGDRDAWAVTAGAGSSVEGLEQFALSATTIAALQSRGIDITAVEGTTSLTHTGSLAPPPGTDGAATP